jgi:uroporphyrinogen-III synthase
MAGARSAALVDDEVDERSELDGYVVGVTADRRWAEQAELLQKRGALVVHGPTIHTRPLRSEGLRLATEAVIADPPDVVVANTGIGMRAWFAAADSWGLADGLQRALAGARRYARGSKASAVLHQFGLDPVARTPSERLDDLVAMLSTGDDLRGASVVFQRHGVDAPDVTAALERLGATVIAIPVYDWTLPPDPRPALRLIEAVASRRVHGLTFTSVPAVRNLVLLADEHGLLDDVLDALQGPVRTACVGPVCAGAAMAAGIEQPLVPEHYRLGALVRCLADALTGGDLTVRLRGRSLLLRGTVLDSPDGRLDLADREAAVLAALARRPGRVVGKETLLREVWGPRATDVHVVEVTVARLRRRLGSLGAGVVVVPRRGYLLEA